MGSRSTCADVVRVCRFLACVFSLLFVIIPARALSAQTPVVRMFVFLSPECSTCEPVHKENIDADADKAGCRAEIQYFDVSEIKYYRKLVDLEQRFNDRGNEMPVVFIGGEVLGGEKEARAKLAGAIAKAAKKGGCDWPDSQTPPAVATATPQTTPTGPIPQVVFDKTSADAGKVAAGRQVIIRFIFINKGKGNLEVKDVRSSCACFHPKVTSKLVAPGKSAAVEVVVKPDGVSTRVDKTVMVDTNDPARPITVLKIKAEMERLIVFSPPRINFGSIPAGKSIEKTLSVLPGARGKFTVRSVIGHGNVRVAGVTPRKGGGYIARLIIGSAQPGRVYENLTVRAGAGTDFTARYSVFGNIVENVKQVRNAR